MSRPLPKKMPNLNVSLDNVRNTCKLSRNNVQFGNCICLVDGKVVRAQNCIHCIWPFVERVARHDSEEVPYLGNGSLGTCTLAYPRRN